MEAYEPFISLGLALAAGMLIGFEREQSAPDRGDGTFLGGARTHPLLALVGAVAVLVSRQLGIAVVVLALAALIVLMAIAYMADVREGRSRGLTSEAAFLVSFLLGALAVTDTVVQPLTRKIYVVSSLAVVSTLLLSIKPGLHAFIQKASKEDIFATLKFLIVAVVVLPLLPNAVFGPLEVLNPFHIGLMVVLIAGISFCGYLAIRLMGARRGLALSGLVGGLVSSTAVTLSFSGHARTSPDLRPSCGLAVVLASSIMFARVLVVVAAVHPPLVATLLVPMGAMGLAGLTASYFFWRHSRSHATAPEVNFHNPFELSSAVRFAILFAVVLLGSKAASIYLGNRGIYAAGLLAGLTDVDAITLSMARLAREGLSADVASTTIFLGALANTLTKAVMASVVGGWAFGRLILSAFAGVLVAGAAGLAAIWLL